MKEIWMINHYAVTPDYPAGTRHYDFAIELQKKGIPVKIFASNFTSKQQEIPLGKDEKYKKQDVSGVNYYWIKTLQYQKNNWKRLANMIHFTLNMFKVGMRLNPNPSLVIGSSPHLFNALGSYFLAKKKKAKFFFEVRDLWPLFLIEISGVSPYHPLMLVMTWIESFLYKKADKIIVLAPGSKDYLLKKGVDEEKIIFIPNGVHLDSFKYEEGREKARSKFGFNKFTAIYTGAHGPANALHNIIEAAEILKDNEEIEFVLVGNGVLKNDLVNMARNKGLNNVRFMDPIPKTEIPSILKAADVGLITLKNVPSFSFGVSPNKLFDYMGSELPVISAVGGEVSRIVKDNGIGYAVEPENPQELAEAVKRIYHDNKEVKEEMGKAARKIIEEKYSRQKLVQKLIEAADIC